MIDWADRSWIRGVRRFDWRDGLHGAAIIIAVLGVAHRLVGS